MKSQVKGSWKLYNQEMCDSKLTSICKRIKMNISASGKRSVTSITRRQHGKRSVTSITRRQHTLQLKQISSFVPNFRHILTTLTDNWLREWNYIYVITLKAENVTVKYCKAVVSSRNTFILHMNTTKNTSLQAELGSIKLYNWYISTEQAIL
jgi:hypothetical protein